MNEPRSRLSRRTLFAGAGTLGALGAVAALLPGAGAEKAQPEQLKPAPERGGGYQLSEHVKRYYKTTLI